jgi:hypothetical protein
MDPLLSLVGSLPFVHTVLLSHLTEDSEGLRLGV